SVSPSSLFQMMVLTIFAFAAGLPSKVIFPSIGENNTTSVRENKDIATPSIEQSEKIKKLIIGNQQLAILWLVFCITCSLFRDYNFCFSMESHLHEVPNKPLKSSKRTISFVSSQCKF